MDDDTKLIERLKNGDMSAFDGMYEKYSRLVMYICFKYVQNRSIAEELTQDVFIKVLVNAFKLDGKRFKAWLWTVTVHHARSFLRHYSKEDEYIRASLELERMNHKRTNDTFKDEIMKKCVIARFILEFSNKDIAASMRISSQRVADYIYQAKQILKDELGNQ